MLTTVGALRVENVQRIAGGSALYAKFDLVLEGFGRIEGCRLIAPADRAPFATGPCFPDRYSRGGWAHPVLFDPEFALELLEVVQNMLLGQLDGEVAS